LICGLHKDKQYRLELYVYSPHSILDSIGIYFSSTDFMLEKRRFTDIDPQLWSADGLDDSTALHGGWKKISLTYTATGAEAYMTIGNFKRADYTGISKGEVRYDYYFFIDKVSLLPIDPDEKLCAEADSMRKEIYAENVRHDMLQKWIYYYTRNPPKPVLPPPTRVQAVERKIIDTLIIPDIFFASGSHELSPRSFSVLDSFVNKLEAYAIDSVVVEGHTDSVGGLAQNEKLSVNRAGSVGKYLSDKIPSLSGKTILRGFAFLRPAASNKTAAGRQQNRRVEIFVYRKE
jgi:outer membrane protein OmpA-like peptidoglycan-associated protein